MDKAIEKKPDGAALSTEEHTTAHSDKVKAYRKLSPAEINQINEIKETELRVGAIVGQVSNLPGVDPRWLAIAKTDLEKGFMALVRSVAKPEALIK